MTTYEGVGNFPSGDEMAKYLNRLTEDQNTAEAVRKHKWAQKSNRMKAEALIAKADPDRVFERDMPKIALAQVHATLALLDFHRGVPEGITNYERTNY